MEEVKDVIYLMWLYEIVIDSKLPIDQKVNIVTILMHYPEYFQIDGPIQDGDKYIYKMHLKDKFIEDLR
jgi:hypothetical protein